MGRNRFHIVIVVLAMVAGAIVLTLSLHNRKQPPSGDVPKDGSMSAIDPSAKRLAEDDIAESVFRYQFTQCFPERKLSLFFLTRNYMEDPSDAFLQRFGGTSSAVKKFSSADFSGAIEDKDSGKRGILLGVRKINWLDDSRVEVEGSCSLDRENHLGYAYSVTREGNRWVVKDSEIISMT